VKTVFDWLSWGTQSLSGISGDQAELEARLLWAHADGIGVSEILAQLRDPVSDVDTTNRYQSLVQLRQTHKPLAYILNEAVFRGRSYRVQPGVLIPRPETEELVDYALRLNPSIVFDVGFGSGVIAIELAIHNPNAVVYGWDISQIAYMTATHNAAVHSCDHITFYKQNFFHDQPTWQPIIHQQSPALVVCNPPYIKRSVLPTLDRDVIDFEPKAALDGGQSGIAFYKRLFAYLAQSNVVMMVEIGYDQGPCLLALLDQLGYRYTRLLSDLSGHDRFIVASFDRVDEWLSLFDLG